MLLALNRCIYISRTYRPFCACQDTLLPLFIYLSGLFTYMAHAAMNIENIFWSPGAWREKKRKELGYMWISFLIILINISFFRLADRQAAGVSFSIDMDKKGSWRWCLSGLGNSSL